jgi:hypothetical protein
MAAKQFKILSIRLLLTRLADHQIVIFVVQESGPGSGREEASSVASAL